MANIANAKNAYVSGGNGNAYSLIKNNYVTCSTTNGNLTLVWNDNNDGTATVTGTLDNTGNSYGTTAMFIIPPANVATCSLQSVYANGNIVKYYIQNVSYADYAAKIQLLFIQSPNDIVSAGAFANITVNISNINYRKLNF